MLEWTGERFLPNVGVQIAYEHYLRYLFARRYAAGKVVLDCPSGEGFGSNILAKCAKEVIGVDITVESVEHSKKKYVASNLRFVQGDMTDLRQFDDQFFDVIICMEGIEHIGQDGQVQALKEFYRILKPDGLLLISTPNRRVYSDIPNYKNPYHLREFYFDEFVGFLRAEFPRIQILGQSVFEGCLLVDIDSEGSSQVGISVFESEDSIGLPLNRVKDVWTYFIAVCSKSGSSSSYGELLVDFKFQLHGERAKALFSDIEKYRMKVAELEKEKLLLEAQYLNTIEYKFRCFIERIFRKSR